MPKFLEDKLKAQAANKGLNEKQTMRYVFGAMNNLGAMHGSVETAKGVAMDAKHAADVKAGRVPKGSQASQTESGLRGHDQRRHERVAIRMPTLASICTRVRADDD